jgi:tetratricopeptide (TPR) repeat protein
VRRLAEARDAFERAGVLAPALVEAMWLRAAVDKSLARLRVAVGTPLPMGSDLPPGELREALVSGRLDDGIRMLRADSTPAAQLRLGDLLLYAGRFEDAIGVFERIDDPAALAGKARALIDLGRTDEALVIFEAIGSDGFTAIRR